MKIGKINNSQDGAVFSIDGDVQTLSAGHGNVPKILLDENTTRQGHDSNNSGGGRSSMSKKHCWDIVAHYGHKGKEPSISNVCPTLKAASHGHEPMIRETPTLHGFEHGTNGQLDRQLLRGGMIRRLTEIECERLQGFPDNHTQYGNYDGENKKVSKTQRYKQCGNAVSVCVVKEIGKRLLSITTKNTKQK